MSRSRCAVGLFMVVLCVSAASSRAAQTAQAARTAAPPSPFSRRARLEPAVARVAALDLTGDSRQAFEKLAVLGGIHVVFHPGFEAVALPPDLTLNGIDFVDALDRLAILSNTFWETYDGKTIVVAPDDPAIRKQVEMQALKVYGSRDAGAPAAASLRTALVATTGVKTLATSTPQNVLMLRESVDNVTFAEGILASSSGGAGAADSGTLLIDFSGNTYTPEAGRLRRTIAGAHRDLQSVTTDPISIRLTSPPREAFQALADRAGIRVVFHRQFAQGAARPFSIEGLDIFAALDLLSFQTGNFWQVIAPHTIVVATDNPTVRRDVEPSLIRLIHVRSLTRPPEVTEAITAMRALAGLNQIVMSTPQNTMLLRDSADRIDLAVRIAAVFDGATFGESDQAFPGVPIASGRFATPADSDVKRAMLAQLQLTSNVPITVTMNQQSRQAFETLASMAGVQVLFHRQFANQAAFPFAVKDVDIGAALDQLAVETGNFWTVADPHTIVVGTDNPTVRRDVEQTVIKPIFLKNIVRQQEVTELVTALRTLLSFNQIALSTRENMILLRDTPDKIALAEKIAAAFDQPAPGAPDARTAAAASAGILSGPFAQPTDEDARRAARSQLALQSRAPLSIRMTQRSLPAFQAVGQMAGVEVLFHRQFQDQAPFLFAREGDDAFTALDRLAFVTGNFWQVRDPHTIVVATDNPTIRRDTEPMVVKTIYLRNVTAQRDVTEIITALRTLLSFNQIAVGTKTGAIVLRDTADKIALAEKIVDLFDPPGGGAAGPVPVAPPIPSGIFANPMDSTARRVRLEQALSPTAPIAINRVSTEFTLRSRQAFETLAARGGLTVTFHPEFSDAAAFAFRVRDVDLIEALDQLAFRTGNFWQLNGEKSIVVAPDNPTIRRNVERVSTRIIALKNIQSPEDTLEIVTAFRVFLSTNQISNSPGIITMTDTEDRIALAERIVADLDIPGRTPLVH